MCVFIFGLSDRRFFPNSRPSPTKKGWENGSRDVLTLIQPTGLFTTIGVFCQDVEKRAIALSLISRQFLYLS